MIIVVDIGRTFTDAILIDESDEDIKEVAKVPSTPGDLVVGMIRAIRQLMKRTDISPSEIGYVAHGTAAALNAQVEKKGAKTTIDRARRRRSRADSWPIEGSGHTGGSCFTTFFLREPYP